jgi:hypothetical protein
VDSTIPPRAMSDPSLIRVGSQCATRSRSDSEPRQSESDRLGFLYRSDSSPTRIGPPRPSRRSTPVCLPPPLPTDAIWVGPLMEPGREPRGDRWPGARRSRAREGHPALGRGAAQNSLTALSPLRRRMGRGAVVTESSWIRATVDGLNADQRAKGGRSLSRRAHSGRASSTVDAAHFSRPRPSGG